MPKPDLTILSHSKPKKTPVKERESNFTSGDKLEFVDALFDLWQEKHPEKRFMQMLIEACPYDDLYFLNDNKLLENIENISL